MRYRPQSFVLACCVMLGLAAPALGEDRCEAFSTGDFEAVIAECNRLIAVQSARADRRGLDEPSSRLLANYYFARAQAFEGKGDLASARADYDSVVRLDPIDVAAHTGRARLVHLGGDFAGALALYDEAIKASREALARAPNRANYWNRSMVCLVAGQFDLAIADADEMIRLEPTASNYDHRATAYALKGDLVKAHADATEAIRLGGIGFTTRGWLYELAGQLDDALVDHEEAVRRDPKSAGAYAFRARARAAKGDAAHAQEDVGLAVKLDPEVGDFFSELYGVGLERAGQRERALVEYEWALRFNPKQMMAIQGRDRIRAARQ